MDNTNVQPQKLCQNDVSCMEEVITLPPAPGLRAVDKVMEERSGVGQGEGMSAGG